MSSSETPPTWDVPPAGESAPTINAGSIDTTIDHPTQIGPYRILSILGEGGMGLVYIAEQREPVHRRVALKVIKLGMDTREVVARFQAERQALAMMDHPSIAKVFDAGATETGRPYFAMELVSGVPITRYCDDQQVSTKQRLELFATVCEAIQHAHAKGVIHRDIKPGNVLVTLVDGKPVPKVIDFGIAKAISQRLTERTVFTQMGRMVGTPEYMSPEQAQSSPLDVDTRTDVYSLGVLLYELLTGALPFEAKTLRSAAHDEVQRIIREVEPPHPSTRFGKLSEIEGSERARRRQETVISLTSALRRELEWIPLKAMRKDREQRYRTASELADDVRNYLLGRPLMAGPETRSYRVRKFLRRNRATVMIAAIMLLLLIGGIVATTYQAVRATRAERQAQQRFNDVRALAGNLVLDLFPQIDRLAGSSGASKQLADTSLQYLKKLATQASNDPMLLRELALAYEKRGDIQGNPNTSNRGDLAAAGESYRLSREAALQGLAISGISRAEKRKLDNALASATMKIGDVLLETKKAADALARFTEAQAMMQRLADDNREDFVGRHNEFIALPRIASAQRAMGDIPASVAATERELELAKALLADFPDRPVAKEVLAGAYVHLSDAAMRSGKVDRAVDALKQSVAIKREIAAAAPDDADAQHRLANSYSLLADALDSARQPDAAIEALEQAVDGARRAVKLDPLNLRSRDLLGRILMRIGDFAQLKGDYDRSAALYQETLELYRKSLQIAPQNPTATQMLVVAYGQLAELERVRHHYDASLAAHKAGIDLLMPLIQAAPDSIRLKGGLAYATRNIAMTHLEADHPDEAVATARHAVELEQEIQKAAPTDDQAARNRLFAQFTLAQALIALADSPNRAADLRSRDRTEARSLLSQCLTEYDKKSKQGTLMPSDTDTIERIRKKLTAIDAPATAPTTSPG